MTKNEKEIQKRNLADYCEIFSKIKVNRSKQRGEAPYKPILLLSVIDLISQGLIEENYIYITDELINRFDQYWSVLSPDAFNGGLSLPFFHLKNDGFWKLKFSDNYDGGRPQTIPKLKEDVDYAILDTELFYFLKEQETRKELIDVLISSWFSSSQKQIEEILKINDNFIDSVDEGKLENTQAKIYYKKSIIRNAFFRKAIVHIYDYRCSLCGLKVNKTLTQSIVDGAHIKPLAQFYDNRINNGVSFCKNHHWAFDNGLFTIDKNYKIIVSNKFEEESPNAKPLKEFHQEILILPVSKNYYPSLEAIQWHSQNIFRP